MTRTDGGEAGTEGDRRRTPGWGAAWAAALAFAVLQWGAASRSTLWDRDEPRYCQAAHRMLVTGDLLVPYYNGAVRPEKPVLIYWLMAASAAVFGPTEFAFRFFAPLGGAATMLMVYGLGRRLLNARAAFWAMLALGLNIMAQVQTTAATTDAVLLAFTTASLLPFALSLERGMTWRGTAVTAAAFALALLTKGPVGVALPLLTMAACLALMGRERPPVGPWALKTAIALLVGLGLFAAWGLPANAAAGGEFVRRGIGDQLLDRVFSPKEGHGGCALLTLPFYVPVLIVGLFPWVLFLPAGLSAVLGGRLGGRRVRALILGWTAPTFVVMTIVQTKLPHYILPIWPALALAVGGAIDLAQRGGLAGRDRKWLKVGLWLFALLALAAVLTLGAAACFLRVPGLVPSCLALALALAAMAVWAIVRLRRRDDVGSAAVLAVGMVVAEVVLALLVVPAVENVKLGRRLASAIRDAIPEGAPVWRWRFHEPSVAFYLDRPTERTLKPIQSRRHLRDWAREPEPAAVLIPRKRLRRIEAEGGPLPLRELTSVRGFNYSKGKWQDIVVLGRAIPPPRGTAAEKQ